MSIWNSVKGHLVPEWDLQVFVISQSEAWAKVKKKKQASALMPEHWQMCFHQSLHMKPYEDKCC